MENKKRKILIVIMMIMFLLGAGLVSYAFLYDINLFGTKEHSINTCSFQLKFKDSNPIRLLESYPITLAETGNHTPYTFYVETINSNCASLDYVVTLEDACNSCNLTNNICTINENTSCNCDENSKIDPSILSYEILKVGDLESVIGTNTNMFSQDYTLTGNVRNTHELKVWINENATEEDLYVYENEEIVLNEDGTYKTKNYCFKLNIVAGTSSAVFAGPICTWESGPSMSPVANGTTANYVLNCIDTNGFNDSDIVSSDIIIDGAGITISGISKVAITDGYAYTITVEGTSVDGISALQLNANSITDNLNNNNLISPISANITTTN